MSVRGLLLVAIGEITAIAIGVIVFGAIFVRRLRQSLRQLHLRLGTWSGGSPSQIDDLQRRLIVLTQLAGRTRDTQKTLKNDLALLHFALGEPSTPSDIVIGETDSYERLDQNWGSIRDTAGRQQSPLAIEGERDRTSVIVILGQSNAANHGSGRYIAKHQVDNFNLYDSKCYHAADPLLGASGDGGNFATRLGDKLIEAGLFDRVILAPIAMGGTMVEQWADEGMFNRRIVVLIRRLHDAGLGIDLILWHQGEGNPGMGDVGGRQYRKNLWEVVSTFRRYGVKAPFFVSLATLCGGPHANAENIRAGQKSAVDPRAGIFLGPDTDTIGLEHRHDACHFNETGLEIAASLWLQVIADFHLGIGTKKEDNGPQLIHAVRQYTKGDQSKHGLQSLTRQTTMSQLAKAFAIEAGYQPVEGPVLVADERLGMATVAASEVAAWLADADAKPRSPTISKQTETVIAWEGLRHAFHPRAALDGLCGQLREGGRLIYAQSIGGVDYSGLTPKWFLDYFIAAHFADCRVYLLWPPDHAPKVATFDYKWMLDNARPVYNPMWDNITYAAAVVVVAEKGAQSDSAVPSQDNYRSAEEWKSYAAALRRLTASSRPWHITGLPPATMPAGYRAVT